MSEHTDLFYNVARNTLVLLFFVIMFYRLQTTSLVKLGRLGLTLKHQKTLPFQMVTRALSTLSESYFLSGPGVQIVPSIKPDVISLMPLEKR